MKRLLRYLVLLLALPVWSPARASAQVEYRSVFGVHPSVVAPGHVYLGMSAETATHLKIYDQQQGRYVSQPASMVFNDVGLNTLLAYGLTDRLTVFAQVPLRSVHLYSLTGTTIGKGFGDPRLGGTFSLLARGRPSSLAVSLSATIPLGANTPPGQGRYPLGLDATALNGSMDGRAPVGPYSVLYSAYYRFVTGDRSADCGDGTGFYLVLDRYAETDFGNFSWDLGVHGDYTIHDRIPGSPIDASYDDSFRILAGLTYYYSPTLAFNVGIPYTVYQKHAWFTTYSVSIGVDYEIGHTRANKG